MKNDELKEIITQAHMAGQHCAGPDIGNASYSDAFAYFSTRTEPKEQMNSIDLTPNAKKIKVYEVSAITDKRAEGGEKIIFAVNGNLEVCLASDVMALLNEPKPDDTCPKCEGEDLIYELWKYATDDSIEEEKQKDVENGAISFMQSIGDADTSNKIAATFFYTGAKLAVNSQQAEIDRLKEVIKERVNLETKVSSILIENGLTCSTCMHFAKETTEHPCLECDEHHGLWHLWKAKGE